MSARFEVVRTFGRGAVGRVELVRDAESGEELARKRLTRLDPVRIRALKRELRLVGSLVHPNLVRLYELGEDDDGPFLLMEAVDGVDVVTHCKAGIAGGPELASVVPQLLGVLRYLHQQGLVHGDLSPANVRVRRDGCVKLLDFGFARTAEDPRGLSGGTPGYMAPERLRGGSPSTESDLYALGALLRRLVGGPADDGAVNALEPRALADIIEALLDPSPVARPSLDVLERTLLPALSATRSNVTAAPKGRLRREALEAWVFGTLVARPGQLIALHGRSGIGKTTVARAVGVRATAAGMSVSWTRARPEERVAFNLLDELVDDAAQRLPGGAGAALGAALERASSAFPTLSERGGAVAHAERVRRRVRAELFGHAEVAPIPPRTSLFADLRLLLEAVDPHASRRLLILDDLQWADRDSMAFVESLLDASGPRTTLLATTRDDPKAITSWLSSRADAVLVDIPPLSEAEVTAYLQAHEGFPPPVAERVAAACEGLPALVQLALRSPGELDPLGETISAVVRDGEPSEKAALATLLVAGGPLPLDDPSMPRRAVDLLVRRGLVTRAGSHVELLHDSLRRPLRAALGADWLRAAHESRASALGSVADAGAQRIRHLLEAGRAEEAAALAEGAAERAWRRSAFDLAADLYEVARARADTPALRWRHVEALEQARRFDEAARVWAELSDGAAPGDTRAAMLLAEAHALLAGRRIAEGRARLDDALRASGAVGLGGGRLRRAATTLRFLAGPGLPPAAGPGSRNLARAERYMKSAALVGYFDTILGLELLLRARATFDRRGDVERAAWCDFLLSFFARFGLRGGAGLARRYRRAAERRMARTPARSAVVRAFPAFLHGYDALRSAEFEAAAETLDVALAMVAGTGEARSFEAQLTTSLRTSAVLATQDVHAAEAAVACFEALAREGVAVAIQCHVENARALLLTWRGRFEEAEALMGRLRSRWPAHPETVQSVLIELYAALPAVLLGDAARVRPRVREACRRARRMRLFRTAYGPLIAGIAAHAEIAARAAGGADLVSARRWAELCAARPSVLTGWGHRALAALEELEGRPERALRHFVRSERQATRLGQAIDAALARFGRGRLERRSALQIDARTQLAAAGASPRLLVEHDVLRVGGAAAFSER